MSASIPNRLTHREAAATLGMNVGQLIKLRVHDGKFFDPSFPKMVHGCFIESEILAWKKSKEALATHSPVGQQPLAPITPDGS